MEFKIGSLMNLISGKSNTETSTGEVTQSKIVFKSVDRKRKKDADQVPNKRSKKQLIENADFIPLESSKASKFTRGKLNKSFKNLRNSRGSKPEIAENSSASVVGKSFRYTGSQDKRAVNRDTTDGQVLKGYPDNEEKLKRTVFVGNLPLTQIGESNISKLFAPFGEIESFRLRSVPIKDVRVSKRVAAIKKDFHPDRTSTNAYVVMKRVEAAAAALALNGKIVDGHHIRIDTAQPSGDNDPRKAIFLGNVSFKAEDDDLWRLFENCGEIESVHILRDKHTNVSKGAAYVNFKSADAVELALVMTDLEVHGRTLVVHRCLPGRKKNFKETSSRQPGPRNKDGPVDDKVRSKEDKRFRKKMIRREKRQKENAKNEALGLRSRPLKESADEQNNVAKEAFRGEKAPEQQKKKKKKFNKGEIQRKKVAKILSNAKKEREARGTHSGVVDMDVAPAPRSAEKVVPQEPAGQDTKSKKKKNLAAKTRKMKQKAKKNLLQQKGEKKKKLKKQAAN